MRRLWWVLGTILVIGIGGAVMPDEAVEESEPTGIEESAAVVEPVADPVTEDSDPDLPTPVETAPDPTPEAPVETPEAVVEAAVSPAAVEGETAREVLETLEVKGRAPKTGYAREQFGTRWADIDRNGCDTRNDILDRDLVDKTFKPGTRDCVVLTGTVTSPFTAEVISFIRGQGTSSEVQIDHVVALSDAWQKGAQQLSPDDRELFANDPLNLLAVDGRSNAQKGAGDAATWLPANKPFRCEYVARQVSVKAKYSLWVTVAEKDAIIRILDTCPGQLVPEPNGIAPDLSGFEPVEQPSPEPTPAPTPAPAPATTPAPAPTTAPAIPAVEDVYYENCAAAKAAGAAPIYKDEPGYRARLDGDGDGVACE